jgi:hypothetical protein
MQFTIIKFSKIVDSALTSLAKKEDIKSDMISLHDLCNELCSREVDNNDKLYFDDLESVYDRSKQYRSNFEQKDFNDDALPQVDSICEHVERLYLKFVPAN